MGTAPKLLYLSQEEIVRCGGLDMKETIAALEEVFQLLAAGDGTEFHGPIMRWPDGRWASTHPAYLGAGIQMIGVKWITSNPKNRSVNALPSASALIIINDAENGFPLAIMEGALITAMRTGAVIGLAAKYLAPPEVATVGLIGAGAIARTQLWALSLMLPGIKLVRVYSRTEGNSNAFAKEMSHRLGLKVEVVSSARDAIVGADLVSPATNISQAGRYIRSEWIGEGTLMANLSGNDYSLAAVSLCDRFVVDDLHQLQVADLTLADAARADLVNPDEVVELASVVTGKRQGRASSEERIFFSPFGLGIEDLINAYRIYQNARQLGVGQQLAI